MTFSLNLSEYLEGWRVFGRSQNRLQPLLVGLLLTAALGTGVLAISQHDWHIGIATTVWLSMSSLLLGIPYIKSVEFRRKFGGDQTPPYTFRFEPEGLFCSAPEGEWRLRWTDLAKPLEGERVWVFTRRDRARLLFIIPKRATQTPEGAREWAFVDEAFAPQPPPLIAAP